MNEVKWLKTQQLDQNTMNAFRHQDKSMSPLMRQALMNELILGPSNCNANSIFGGSNSMSGVGKAAVACSIFSGIAQIASVFMSRKTNGANQQTGAAQQNGTSQQTQQINEANQAGNGLKSAMKTADKTGDWSPVKQEEQTAETTLNTNKTQIQTIETAIQQAKAQIETITGDINKLQGENADIENKQIPAAQATKDNAYAKADADYTTAETAANAQYDAAVQAANASIPVDTAAISKAKDAKDAALKKADQARTEAKKKADETFNKTKTQLEDKKKQNLAKISKDQELIKDQDKIIKGKTSEKTKLESANEKLQQTIDEAKQKLDLHLGSIDSSSNDSGSTANQGAGQQAGSQTGNPAVDNLFTIASPKTSLNQLPKFNFAQGQGDQMFTTDTSSLSQPKKYDFSKGLKPKTFTL